MKTYNLNEITDSKILYDKRPPKFMYILIILVVLLLSGFITWSYYSIRTYVVKGQGLITKPDKSQIMTKVSGEITEVSLAEGKIVKKGEMLIKVNPVESNMQINQASSQINVIDKRINLLKRAEKEATQCLNTFKKDDLEEAEFYNKLANSYNKKKEYKVDESALKAQQYTQDQIDQYKKTAGIKTSDIYYSTIIEFTNEIKQLELEKNKLEGQKSAIEKSSDVYVLTAPKDGKIHLETPITKGMVLQAGMLIGSIAKIQEKLLLETLLPSTERPRIRLNSEVEIAIGGLNQSEYGTLKGKVIEIDEDATVNKEKGNVFFKVKILPQKTYLVDKKGEKVNLTLGMVGESRVRYEKVTYLNYFLEQIGIDL